MDADQITERIKVLTEALKVALRADTQEAVIQALIKTLARVD